MKNTITHTAEWILVGILGILLCYTVYKSYQIKHKVEYITTTDTIKLNDTITNWQYDTVYFSHFDTIKLPVIKLDTLLKTDSVYVQIPYMTTVYDTVIKDTNYETSLKAVLSGFGLSVDTLCLSTEIMPQKVQITPKKWYDNLGIGVGVMLGTGGVGIGAGVMYKL